MSYQYATLRNALFTDEGQRLFIKVRDHVMALMKVAGCFTMGKAMDAASGDNWLRMACVDRLVELGEIVEILQENPAGQNRIFRPKGWGGFP